MSRLATLSLNDEVSKAKKSSKAKAKSYKVIGGNLLSNGRIALTVLLGIGIPCLSLALSHLGGSMLSAPTWTTKALGGAALGLCCTVLAVSLRHLRDAIGDITHSGPELSWLLAVAIDLSLVTCELIETATDGSGVAVAVMFAVTAASMALNVWAFLRH